MEASFSLPTPTDTPYRTPSSSRSRQSREYEDMSPPTVTSPPLPVDEKEGRRRSDGSNNAALDESISPLDPRRFTPTLHASLVSEILSLRRDLERKTNDINQLEQTLYSTQLQNDSLSKNLLNSNKEVRSVKRQMQLLEGGTLSAINDVSRERDAALGDVADLRKRLEQSQKRARGHEDNSDYTNQMWEKEKETWAVERRTLETKIHVIESRLKVVLSEVANTQHNSMIRTGASHESPGRSSRPGSPVKRPFSEGYERRQSVVSTGSDQCGGRVSVLSFANEASTNLAEELALEDIDEVHSDAPDNDEGRISPDALPEERNRPTSSLSFKARRVLGLPFDIEDMEHGDRVHSLADAAIPEESTPKPMRAANYVDSYVQYSRPGTPVFDANVTDVDGRRQIERPFSPGVVHSGSESGHGTSNGNHPKRQPAMVSSSCQTTESLPSPPLTPRHHDGTLATIPESTFERIETRETATQTDVPCRLVSSYRYNHSHTETHDLGVPTIAIIPPGSRSVTPENSIALPPQTKNASCQVESAVVFKYTTASMQTEEIRVDRRNVISPHLMPGALVSTQVQAATSKGKAPSYSRRGLPLSSQPASNSGLKRSAPMAPVIPPLNDDGPLARDRAFDKARPVRSSSLFAGFDDHHDELEDNFEDDMFDDEDVFGLPVARFTLRSGKLVSLDKPLDDAGELTAASAGEAMALEMLRQSEDNLPPEMRRAESLQRAKGLSRTTTIRRGQSASRQSNMRKSAIISNGTAVHQSKHSQSTIASSDGGNGVPPPIPVPLRYSSARVGKSFSEGGRSSRGSNNNSPTRQGRSKNKPSLRKSRSGPALSPAAPAARRQRSTSPPHDARISIVPEMPTFLMPSNPRPTAVHNLVNMPENASAPRPSIATGPSRNGHTKNNSNAGALQQTSVVDAIAQTMVGEWMFKYVRRRKSFGKPDKDWDPNKSADELINNPSSAGVRHKRWVWVAPYERSVMWSSKQPTTGTALMGKSGRKLTIKSVLDVKDENPMPKNSLNGPQFNRSILILTPQRALKFTATSQERHYIWLTALSFLSHSPLSIGDLAALPPPPEELRSPSPPPSLGGSFRRRTIRDSIRVTKGYKQTFGPRSFTTDGSTSVTEYADTRPPTGDFYDASNDAAVPPTIKRYHARHRSNTAPKAPPSAFRSFSHRDNVVSPHIGAPSSNYTQSVITTTDRGSSDRGQYTPSFGNPSIPSSRRGSEASALSRPQYGNNNFAYNANNMNTISSSFFDSNSSHIGVNGTNSGMTMRMDAFIENKQAGRGGLRNLKLGIGPLGSFKSGVDRNARKDPNYWGADDIGAGASSISPLESPNPTISEPTNGASLRLADSLRRGSAERAYLKSLEDGPRVF